MKKILLIIGLFAFILQGFSQETTVSITMKNGVYYYEYKTDVDLVKTTNDTVDYVFQYQSPEFVKKVAIQIEMDTGDVPVGAENIAWSLFGKEFENDDTWVEIIASTNSADVTSDGIQLTLTSDYTETIASYVLTSDSTAEHATWTAAAQTITPFDKTYRYFRLRGILEQTASATEGITVDNVEFKLYID